LIGLLARPAGLWGAATAPGVASYTAVLLSQTAVPAWREAHPFLPFVFVGSAAASGGGLGMLLAPVDETGPARRMAVAGAALEVTASRVLEQRLGLSAEAYTTGKAHRLRQLSEVLTVAGALGALVSGRRRWAVAASGAALLTGSALQRFGVFEAGVESTHDPKYVVVPQRERLNAGTPASWVKNRHLYPLGPEARRLEVIGGMSRPTIWDRVVADSRVNWPFSGQGGIVSMSSQDARVASGRGHTGPEHTPRLRLKPKAPTNGHVDGAWWPHGNDLSEELPDLLAVLSVRLGPIDRVLYNLGEWAKAPRRLVSGGRAVRLDGYRRQPANTLQVLGLRRERLLLLVVPPHTDPDQAHATMMTAAAPDNATSVDDLLAPGAGAVG
jgi:Family of unknown function (DUF5994)